MVFNGLWFTFNILAVVLRCLPVARNWDPTITTGHCADQLPIVLTVSTWSLFLSLMVWSLPVPMVWRLQTTRKRKIALTLLFALGIFDIIVGIVRVVTITRVDFVDFTYSEVPALQWLLVEPAVAILCASLPTIRPLVETVFSEAFFSRLRSLTRRSRSSQPELEEGIDKHQVETDGTIRVTTTTSVTYKPFAADLTDSGFDRDDIELTNGVTRSTKYSPVVGKRV